MSAADELLFISTTPGLEPALELECRALGFLPKVEVGGVSLHGAPGLHRELNLRLRTASRVLLRVAELKAGSSAELSEGLKRTAMNAFIPRGAPVTLSAASHQPRVREEKAEELAREVWKLTRPPPRRSEEDEDDASFRIQLRLVGDACTVSVDTSGELLHRRGYRQEVSHAPLRESLAAGMLMLAGYDGRDVLIDPMCGSGTVVIEAALMAQRRAPGMDRSFAFERFTSFDEAAARALADLKDLLRSKETKPAFKLQGADLHAGALGAARRNGKRAGVTDIIELNRRDVAQLETRATRGFVISNPPYGKRVGEKQALPALYENLGRALRRLKGFRFGLLVADEQLEKKLELPVTAVHRLHNGGIWCRFLVGDV